MNLPNKLTVLRMIMVPFFIFVYFAGFIPYNMFVALVIFVIASFTDMLDGKIARKYNLVSNFGKLMDPLADKLLVTSAMVCILGVEGYKSLQLFPLLVNSGISDGNQCSTSFYSVFTSNAYFIGAIALIIVLSRDLIVNSVRQVAADNGLVIAADIWGKIKTVCQMVWTSLALLNLGIWGISGGVFEMSAGFATFLKISTIVELILFAAMLIMTVASGLNYVIKNRKLFADA